MPRPFFWRGAFHESLDRRAFVAGGLTAVFSLARGFCPIILSKSASTLDRSLSAHSGGGTDFFARLVGSAMAQSLGQPVVISIRAGAGTIIGAEAAARSAPDCGYTPSCWATSRPPIRRESTFTGNCPSEPSEGFQSNLADGPVCGRASRQYQQAPPRSILSPNSSHWPKNPQAPSTTPAAASEIRFISPPNCSPGQHRSSFNHIPYRGAAPALQDLAAGQVGMMFVDFATARSQLGERRE